ncbi:Tetratricopeptide repeat protein 21B, partial [Frankliniella fusca]
VEYLDYQCVDLPVCQPGVLTVHRQGNTAAAAQSLEVAVSYSFAVRERPLFHLLTALVQRARGDADESFKSLTAAQALSGLRPGSGGGGGGPGAHALTRSEQATLLLELATLQQQQGRWPEAMLALHDAAERFRDTAEEGRVVLAHAALLLARGEHGDPASALAVLAAVRPGQAYHLQARHQMAHIHLRVRKDRRAYAEVFRQLVDQDPGPQSLVLLGDAYMAVQEPEKAIETYEQALRKSPPNRNPGLACKTGRALVQTHQYGKALNYYREAVRGDGDPQLRLDMALLCLKLGQLDKADAALSQELAKEPAAEDAEALSVRVRMHELQARVRERAGTGATGAAVGTVTGVQAALASLQEARVVQARVLKLVAAREGEDSEAVAEQRAVGARLCRQMALHAASLRDNAAAVRYYREALVLQQAGASEDAAEALGPPTAETSDTLIALAKLYMQVGDLEQCQATCQTLLRAVPEHDAATVMMADLAFRRVDLEGAWQHFSALLQRRPAYWTALARLVEVSRRRGQLASCVPFLDAAEAQDGQRAQPSPGLSYCRGLYSWYACNASQALHQFNAARRDPEWGQQAVHNMIEICLDGQSLGQSLGAEDVEDRDARQAALATAERLLAELRGAAGGAEEEMSKRLLANQLLLAKGDKRGIERAVQDLTAVVSSETESHREPVGAVLGLAQALLLQKQTQRARNQLKRLARTAWTVEQASHLERAWLLLADLYIQQGKQELAADLLRRVLQHNQGCTRAYESLGVMAEKEQAYREAAGHYERAWRLGAGAETGLAGGAARSQPALGYKLAFQYMKCKHYADAIDVCHQVLAAHPNYPRIRKDILDKSRNHLRT